MSNLITLSSGIDIHVHFREPGMHQKETMKTGMKAANSGGITTVIDMPNTIPPTDTLQNWQEKEQWASRYRGLNLAAGMTTNNIENGELSKLVDVCKLFKVFLANSTGNLGINATSIHKGLEIMDNKGCTLMFHAELPDLIRPRVPTCIENEVRPEIAEIQAIEYIMDLQQEYKGINFHITHVSTFDGANLLVDQNRISWDILHKYIDFNAEYVSKMGNFARMNPPLRDERNVIGLNTLFEEGKIPMISSDHAPHTKSEKKNMIAGAPGVQELYYVLIDRYLNDSISRRIMEDTIVYNPNQFLEKIGIEPFLGEIIVDTELMTTVNDTFIKSKCGWSLWDGRTFKGRIIDYKY